MKLLATILLLLLPGIANAQENFDARRFLPLGIGNQWEYAEAMDGESITNFVQFFVLGDTTVDGTDHWKIERTDFDLDGTWTGGAECAVRVGSGPEFDVEVIDIVGSCQFRDCFPRPLFELGTFDQGAPGTFSVGESEYQAAMITTLGSGACHGGSCEGWTTSVASDVGPYECYEQHDFKTTSRADLIFARIGDESYGEHSASIKSTPHLRVEPDTLFFSSDSGPKNQIVAWNDGIDSLRIDSLSFSTAPPASDNGWLLRLGLSEATYDLSYAFGELETSAEFPDIRLGRQDSLQIEFVAFDECLVCGSALAKGSLSTVRDTLFIYSNDGHFNPNAVPIDFSQYVGVETPEAVPSMVLQIYPNPSTDRATVHVVADRSGLYRIAIFNVLGQRLSQVEAWLRPGQIWDLRWPERGRRMPSGTYIIRLSNARAYATRSLTLSR